jgi:hypothetical protein
LKEDCLKRRFLCAVLFVAVFAQAFGAPSAANSKNDRRGQLVEANIIAVHAYQMLLARKQQNMDPACWPATPKDSDLEALVAHQTSLLSTPSDAKAWASGKKSSFDPAKDLQPLLAANLPMPANLPVNIFTAYLKEKAPKRSPAEVRSVANLYQTVLEVERDGDRLQDLYSFYIALGLPVYVGQFGLSGGDEDLLVVGRQLEGKSCVSPVGTTAAEWQIAGRKIWNWGEKNLHIRDANVVAKELLAEPDVKTLEPKMKALTAQRIAVIGHSYTMNLHWSSPSAFVPIVTAMFTQVNPNVQFRQFEGGGLTASRAYKNFYQDALAWKPDTVLFVVANRTEDDFNSLRTMAQGFEAAGARVVMFDDVHDPDSADPAKLKQESEIAQQAGIEVVKVSPVLAASPDKARFLCLDHIHMTEPYHRLMAKQWIKVIVKEPLIASN